MKIEAVRKYALSLPEAAEEPHFDFASFRVRGKIFVTVPPGDKYVHVFVGDDAREQAIELHDEFVEKLFWGRKVLGVRVRLSRASAPVVKKLIHSAWARKAPKNIAVDA